MDDLTFELYKMAAVTIGLIVGIYLIPTLRRLAANIQDEQLRQFIKTAVYMAQQTMQSDDGTIKYNRVRALVVRWLDEHGMKLTEEQLKILIESAVFAMKNGMPE